MECRGRREGPEHCLRRRGAHTSIMMTVTEIVSLVTPPMKEAAPIRAKAPGSIQDHMLGGRKTPAGALKQKFLTW